MKDLEYLCVTFLSRKSIMINYAMRLTLKSSKNRNNIFKQLEIGLVLILDYNEDRQLDSAWRKKNRNEHFKDRKGKFFNHNGDNEAHIYFDSLSQI